MGQRKHCLTRKHSFAQVDTSNPIKAFTHSFCDVSRSLFLTYCIQICTLSLISNMRSKVAIILTPFVLFSKYNHFIKQIKLGHNGANSFELVSDDVTAGFSAINAQYGKFATIIGDPLSQTGRSHPATSLLFHIPAG